MPKVAIIVRAKNEERWIARCLKMVFNQSFTDFEVVLVDNRSTDHTIALARRFPVRTLTIDEFRPGRAINDGVRATDSEYIACLSAHCIPRDDKWLEMLVANMERPTVAGVYGRQLPFAYSSDLNKRDLLITFGLDHRIQTKDYFFHNANSLIRRSAWRQIPFDESLTNIEDRAWGKAVIEAGYQLAYEPEAAVYHHHGIHQDRDASRARNIVRIMESLGDASHAPPQGFGADSLNVVAVLPVRGPVTSIGGRDLLERCLTQLRESRLVKNGVVIAEDPAAIGCAQRHGLMAVSRPPELAESAVSVEQVIAYALKAWEDQHGPTDAVVYANYLYPFRPDRLFDTLVEQFAGLGADSVVPTLNDYQAYWVQDGSAVNRVDSGFTPHGSKTPVQRGMVGLGCISSSEFVRAGRLLGDNVALLPSDEPRYAVKAGDEFARSVIELFLNREQA